MLNFTLLLIIIAGIFYLLFSYKKDWAMSAQKATNQNDIAIPDIKKLTKAETEIIE